VIVTVHDLIPLKFPCHYPAGIRGQWRWRGQKRRLQKVDGILTVSNTSRKDIAQLVCYPQEKIKTTYLAASSEFKVIANRQEKKRIAQKYSLPQNFVLYVGDVNWNKNVPGLVRACQKLALPLVIVGKQAVARNYDQTHPENQDLVWLQQEAKKDKNIQLLGFIDSQDLPIIYNLASVYCQPSFYEGFGLPVVEAMACGCPVVSSNQGSLPEVGGQAVIYGNPYQKGSLAQAINKVTNNPQLAKKLSLAGPKQAAKFSWQKCAQETLKFYRQQCS
jgi:glycosyltransferase involved in cell wall biosynthesis